MVDSLQILSLILVAVAMVPPLAHALELPGKLRLSKDAYFAVQPIYYPGFTIAGISEPLAIISTIFLLAVMPRMSADFSLMLMALIGLISMHGVYWIFTHPVNNFWLQDKELSSLGSGFFSLGSTRKQRDAHEKRPSDWTQLRTRWEYSHVARAGIAVVSFIALVVAVSSVTDK